MTAIQDLFRYIPDFERGDFDSLAGFEKVVYNIVDDYPEYDLKNYNEILQENGLEWSSASLSRTDVSDKDVQCLLAMILSIIRAERFSDCVLMEFLNEGYISKWLNELQKRYQGESNES